jgi:diadenosine tetraphosphate (Ap4A) HIT family hydrolase
VNKVSNAIHSAFSPDKVNYGAYGDTGSHLHFHLVPKYKEEFEWSQTFSMDPKQTTLSTVEYTALIEEIKKFL